MAGDADRIVGYCTNVHAGATLGEVRASLETHALAVKALASPAAPLGIGLWLPARAARELRETGGAADLAGWLREAGLNVFTVNGFPYGDFRRQADKRDVYTPDWRDERRLRYTLDLAHVLEAVLAPGVEGSISTLPLGLPGSFTTAGDLGVAVKNLHAAARCLAEIEQRSGVLVHLDLEPEPGCCLDTSVDVVAFFERHLLDGGSDDLVRRHLRVCHDICHAAVMFEDQAEVLARYDAAGITVGKVQVSSAVRARLAGLDPGPRQETLDELAAFDEPGFLHQTVLDDGRFFADLPEALAARPEAAEWRVHFHVPIFLDRFGRLETTRDEIERCLTLLRDRDDVRHFEIETYAWDVLPPELREETLAAGIARELAWFRAVSRAGQPA